MPRYAILAAPSVLGLWPSGVERLPDALLAAGLQERLDARLAEPVEPPAFDGTRDPATLILNPGAIAAYSVALADAVGDVIDRGEFPVVLGGDCSIMLGGLLALKRRGRFGLLFLDGHADFYQPEAELKGEAASMDLALATGRGPAVVTDLESRGPLVRDEDAVAVGFRDHEDQRREGSQPLPPALRAFDLPAIRGQGLESAARAAVDHVTRPELDGAWLHLDVDVLDDAVMPAVDYRQPDGLSFDEVAWVLRAALASGRAVGLEVTIFNPTLDPDGSRARGIVDCVADGLRG